MNIIWLIVVGVVGFVIGRMSVRVFSAKSPEALVEMREEAKEALEKRTKQRKEEILEMMSDFEVQQKLIEKCDVKNAKKGIEREDVEKRLGVSGLTASKYLNELENESKIRQVGKSGPGVYYELLKRPNS